ncbi:7-cyano-7-deazaguanine synthase QueC [Methanobrevibacter sp. OttesenSCG-928-K11]|nr:7-cyano-7-deazaguanine synthase QueC [Methanobrevibacter sp. OttesenSCG-928-K11]MDL2270217.1 7-cyano-7-deazaguanine synthase QueC [Methanobrevibacter sp. OttesenSCG-928-I08]
MVKKAIAVLSGGLDSTVATAKFSNEYEIHGLTFDYGQKASTQEIKASKEICKKLNAKHTVMDLKWLGKISKSSLTSEENVPKLDEKDLDDLDKTKESAESVWVPGRNILFTAIAISFAEAEGASKIIVGWDKEEAETFPDNSEEFLEKYNELIQIGSPDEISIEAPAIDLDKVEIVELGLKVNAPMDLSYSCYTGNEKHCGICESCMRRKRAFKKLNITDPTEYEN